jgi:hypothetical protein
MVNKDCLSARETRWCRFPGIASEIIHLIAKHMNISVVEVEHDKTFGVEQVGDFCLCEICREKVAKQRILMREMFLVKRN